jgi:hypothetical protein
MVSQSLALTSGLMLLGIAVLFFAIRALVRLVGASALMRLPAIAEQAVAFERTGTFILRVEHPRFKTALSHAEFSLRDTGSGEVVRSWPVLLRATSSGFSEVRIAVRGFAVERPGRYILSVSGIAPGSTAPVDVLIFTRPYGAALILLILGILVGAACTVGGMVFSALHLAGK